MKAKNTSKVRNRYNLNLLLIGFGRRSLSILQILNDFEEIKVLGVIDSNITDHKKAKAKELNIKLLNSIEEIKNLKLVDLILETTQNNKIHKSLLDQEDLDSEIVSAKGTQLIVELLKDRLKKKKIIKSYHDLKKTYQEFVEHEKGLEEHKKELEQANRELEKRLSEIFFTHEFFKALTSFINVEEVCNLISDGANGILGAEISGVYLKYKDQNRLYLQSCQGRSQDELLPEIKYGSSIIGMTASENMMINIPKMTKNDLDTFMVDEKVTSQTAVPLSIGNRILGVLGIASTIHRSLTEEEIDRLITISNMASLSLQNALFNQELEKLSITDRLTELYNHGYFQQRLEEELHRAERSQTKLSLILMDIDYFKQFNDTYGHPCGDKLLQRISKIIKEQLRDTDVAARYGGEEFVVILPETNQAGIKIVAERIRKAVEKEKFKGNAKKPVVHKTISLGVATFPDDASSQPKLIEVADQALYKAKHAGRNQIVYAEDILKNSPKSKVAN